MDNKCYNCKEFETDWMTYAICKIGKIHSECKSNSKYMLILHNRHKEVVEIPFTMDFNAPYVMCFDNYKTAENTRTFLNGMIDQDGVEEKVAWDLIDDLSNFLSVDTFLSLQQKLSQIYDKE